ncbi:hypothetical protein Scep_004850 [Stephania cephalantha]|uniref:non-specific serine/threonine protein kinase n=1 Tax=Stephania cephalantha TaxID=152367 RepID=A0AAP0PZI4_9MAGN
MLLNLLSHFSLSLLLCFCNASTPTTTTAAAKTEFDFGTLTLSNLKLLGDAHLNNNTIGLTRDLPVPNSGAGRVLYSNPVRFRSPETNTPSSFSTFFSFTIANLNPSSIGGGIAFLLSPDDAGAGDAGGYLGLRGSDGSLFFGVEFDTLMDVEFNDINGNHVGIDLNSLVSDEFGDLGELEIDLKSGNVVNAWIDFDGPSRILNVSVSYSSVRPNSPFLSSRIELEKYVNDFMFVGFSASTQGSTETHTLQWWSFTSSSSSQITRFAPPPPAMPNSTNSPPPAAAAAAPATSASAPEQRTDNYRSSSSSSLSCRNELCKRNPAAVAGVVTAGAFILALLACFLIWVYSKKPKFVNKAEVLLPTEIVRSPKEFSYRELKSATKGFDSGRVIGHGAFGTVYKGIFPSTGAIVAVKRCSHNGEQGKTEFLSELSIIATLRHRNLLRLQGWCHEKGEILLIYDYMANGSLDKALFDWLIPPQWHLRRKILIGVASALAYLHQECENQVIHRDVKSSNIMLDEEFNPRLGDFGLARQFDHDKSPDATMAAGTMGYLAPEYLLTGKATDKSDVFSFGAVVLEVVCGRRPIEREGGFCSLVDWVWSLHREGRVGSGVDVRLLGGEFDEEEMRRVVLVGLACSSPDPITRPTMRSVVQMLSGEAEPPLVPRSKPSMSFINTSHLLLSLQDSVSDCNALITISSSSSSPPPPNEISLIGNGSGT